MPIPHPTYPDHTPPHIVGIETVGLKSHLDRRNNASDAIAITGYQLLSWPFPQSSCSPRFDPSIRELTCPRIDQSANCLFRELCSPRVDCSVRELSPRIDQSAIRLSAMWFVRELTSNHPINGKLSLISCSVSTYMLLCLGNTPTNLRTGLAFACTA